MCLLRHQKKYSPKLHGAPFCFRCGLSIVTDSEGNLKDKFSQKLKNAPLSPLSMLMESLLKFCRPQNIAAASRQNSAAAFS